MNSAEKNIEILAPAGSLESVYAAVRCGADAVYVGGSCFSARANAVNFTSEELSEAVNYCHLHNVKLYQALNTLVFDDELRAFLSAAEYAADIGVDALIIQDIGALKMVRDALPDMKINASTQMTVHTVRGAELAMELGCKRVVLSRELSLESIAEISRVGIETEVFVHGALCMSVSGQCYMSAMIGSRSADRGLCAQACRLPFSAMRSSMSAAKEDRRYDLSLKDLSAVEDIDELRAAGVTSLKIEGRMKRAEYVAAAVSACRAAADGKEPDTETLRAVFSRSGFTDGYLKSSLGADMFGIRQKEDVVSAEEVLPQLRERYRREAKALKADFHAVIKCAEPSSLTMNADGISVCVRGNIPQVAKNRPTDLELLEKQLSKLGDTPYELGSVTADTDGGLILTASELNAMRRSAVEALDGERLKAKRIRHRKNEISLDFIKTADIKPRTVRIRVEDTSQLDGLDTENTEYIILPLAKAEKSADMLEKTLYKDKIILALPRFTVNEDEVAEKLDRMKKLGFCKILCTNIAHIRIGREKSLEMHGGFGLNLTNSYSMRAMAELGLADCTASFEMKLSQLSRLGDYIPYGIIAYGRLPVMLTRNCPVKQAVGGCKYCTGILTDRTGREFPVRCDGTASEILNSDILVMSDRLGEISASFIELDFNEETPSEIADVLKAYRQGGKPDGCEYTRGLYYRGVL